MFKLSKRSLKNLVGVHPDLVKVVHRAIEITEIDFVVLEGVRTLQRQRQLVDTKASRTMRSYHLVEWDGYGHAVDLGAWVAGNVRWEIPVYLDLAKYIKKASFDVGVPLQWGYDMWKWDCPHWQLPKTWWRK